MKVVGFDFAEIVPSCCSTMVLHIARPRPVPFAFVVNNGSNIFGTIDFGIPIPESSRSIFI